MKNIEQFLRKYNLPLKALDLIQNQLFYSMDSPEHPIYHPEKTLIRHIDIVVGRSMEFDSKELHFATLFHDITKSGYCPPLWEGRRGELKTLAEGSYWQNIYHAEQAGDFMELLDVKECFEKCGVDFELTHKLVTSHMKMKNFLAGERGDKGGMGESKRKMFEDSFGANFHLMRIFSEYCDSMKTLSTNKQNNP